MIGRTLARRLSKLEERFRPAVEPMTIVVSYIDSNGEVTSGYELRVGGEGPRLGNSKIPAGRPELQSKSAFGNWRGRELQIGADGCR